MFSFRTLPPASIRSGFCLRGSAECTARQASPQPSWSASGSSGGVVVVLAAAVAAVAAGPTDQLELFTGTFISQPPSTSWVVYLASATSGVSSRTTAPPEIKSLQMQVELQSSSHDASALKIPNSRNFHSQKMWKSRTHLPPHVYESL